MKVTISILTLLCFCLSGSAADQKLYLAAGNAIHIFSVNAESGKLQPVQQVELPGAGPFTFSNDGMQMYVTCGEKSAPQISTFKCNPDGTLEQLNAARVNYRSGQLQVDRTGHYLAGHSYAEGLAMLWKLDDGVFRGKTVKELELEPKAHSAVFSPDNRWLLVPATAPNKVFVNSFSSSAGTLIPNDPPFAMGPQEEGRARQPRHLIFHPSLPDVVYTTCEREKPGVCVWKWDGTKGTLHPVQDVVTEPDVFKGRVSASTLHLTPDARFLYVANRNILSKKAKTGESSIVGFRVDPDSGQLTLIGHTPCENVPRSFCIDRSGRFVYVAGQHDDRLGVYAINPDTGALNKVEQHEVGSGPNWVEVR